jgi:autotransporter-associated beta strand protein/predicted outer membrane repeat protein
LQAAEVLPFLNVYEQDGANDTFDQTYPSGTDPTPIPDASTYQTDTEISLDVEWAHALAPAAIIDLIEAYTPTIGYLTDAISYAATSLTGVSVISMSFAGPESIGTFADSDLSKSGVTFVASSGDSGSYTDTTYPYSAFSTDLNSPNLSLGSTTDTFNYGELQTTTSDFTVVTYVGPSTTATQAGISIRNGTSPAPGNEPNVSLLENASDNPGTFQYRDTTGGGTGIVTHLPDDVGYMLALNRQGYTYNAYISYDGINWISEGSVSVPLMDGSVTIDFVGAGASSTQQIVFPDLSYVYTNPTTATNTPATSPNVLSVGGTDPSYNDGSIASESTAWGLGVPSYGLGGSGGGYSSSESRPAYQGSSSLDLVSNGLRAVPDVSIDAGAPVAVYDTDNATPTDPWYQFAGTSFSCVAWAALVAVADQERVAAGLPTLTSTATLGPNNTQALLYNLPTSGSYAAFNDITTGSNGVYSARTGYDLVTGLGTPKVALLTADLAAPEIVSGTTLTITVGNSGSTITGTTAVSGGVTTLTVVFTPTGGTTTTRTYTGINCIVVQGGTGNDSIDMSGVTSSIACDLIGGAGNDTLAGNGSDTFSGGTGTDVYNITGGTLQLGGATSLGSASVIVESGATLDLNGQSVSNALTLNGGTLANSSTSTAAIWSGGVTLESGSTVNGGGNMTISGVISNSSALTKAGTGTLTLSGANTYAGGTTINAGTLIIGAAGSLPSGSGVTNNSGLIFDASSTAGRITGDGSLTIGTSSTLQLAASSSASTQGALSINSGSTLDITSNTLYIDYGTGSDPESTIRADIINGRDGGSGPPTWEGTGITSSTAAANPTAYSIGYADGDNGTDLANVPGLTAGEVEIKYTVAGDANLSGGVDLSDLVIVASDFGETGADWAEGDVNYDGNVDLSDLVIVASNFGSSLASIDYTDFGFTDPTQSIYVDESATGSDNGSSWSNAYTSLQFALSAAASTESSFPGTPISIFVAQGTYYPTSGTSRTATFQLINDVAIIGGFAGDSTSDPGARNVTLYPTILSGDIGTLGFTGDNSYNVVTGSGTNSTAALDGVTIADGNAGSDGGGGLYDYDGSPTIVNCTITECAGYYGGGMMNYDSSPTLINCVFGDCSAYEGGGMYSEFDEPKLTNCLFTNDTATEGGGGVYTVAGGLALTDCTFISNSAPLGGAIESTEATNLLITDCTFDGDSASIDGGAIYGGFYSYLAVIDCEFTGDSVTGSSGDGGAIFLGEGAYTCTYNSTFTDNSAPGTGSGGAIYGDDSQTPIVEDCVLWNDSGGEIGASDSRATASVGWSDVDGGYTGTDNMNANPLFVRSPNLGSGDYGDLELQSNSPCINAGRNSWGTPDLAGNARIVDTTVDMGAFEYQGSTLPAVTDLTINYSGSAVNGLAITFNTAITAGSITLYNPNGTAVPLDVSVGSDTLTLSFSSLPAGQYVLAVDPYAGSLSGGTEYFVFDSA